MAGDDNPAVLQAESQENRIRYTSSTTAYPYGLPRDHASMVYHKDEVHPEHNSQDRLHVNFYVCPPKDVKAIFSTKNGELEPRPAIFILQRGKVKLWDAETTQKVANTLRTMFSVSFRDMREPQVWNDLYHYFDAHDLYWQGPHNLWNVIRLLWQENQKLLPGKYRTMAYKVCIWSTKVLDKPGNEKRLLDWDREVTIDILNALPKKELEDVRHIRDVDLVLVRATLQRCRAQLKNVASALPKLYPGNTLGENWAQADKWLTDNDPLNSQGPPVDSKYRVVVVCGSTSMGQVSGTGEAASPPAVASAGNQTHANAPPPNNGAYQNVSAVFPVVGSQQSPAMMPSQQPATYHTPGGGSCQSSSHGPAANGFYGMDDNQRLSSLNVPRQRASTNISAGATSVVTGVPALSNAPNNVRNTNSRGSGPGSSAHGSWVMNSTHDLHGPTHRRSPQRYEGEGRPHVYSALPAIIVGECPNHHTSTARWHYTPCACYFCEVRNRSVCVSFTPRLQTTMSVAEIREVLRHKLSRYGEVVDVSWNKLRTGGYAFIVQFREPRVAVAAAYANGIVSSELSCKIVTSATHRSNYGYEWAQRQGLVPVPDDNNDARPRSVAQGSSSRAVSSTSQTAAPVSVVQQLAASSGHFSPTVGQRSTVFAHQLPVALMGSMVGQPAAMNGRAAGTGLLL